VARFRLRQGYGGPRQARRAKAGVAPTRVSGCVLYEMLTGRRAFGGVVTRVLPSTILART
jgi:hypothetical protein